MQYIFAGLAVIGTIILLIMSISYYRSKQKGKGYVAVAAITGIGTTWAAYVSLLSVPWRVVLVVVLHADPQLAAAIQPNTTAILASTFGLIIVDSFLYILASKSLRKGRLPVNASAEEVEDLTGAASVLALALAHARFRFAGRPDNPIRLPGESPYKLPDPQRKPDWTALSADLLVQLEPNLVRETFRYVHERQLFILSGADVLDPTREMAWLVCPVPSRDHVDAATELLQRVASTSKLNERTTLAICVDTTDQIDGVEHIESQHEIRILSKAALVDKGLDFSYYAASLIRRFEQRVVSGADYTLRDCFVSPKVRRVRADGNVLSDGTELSQDDRYDLLDHLNKWADRPGVDHISIVGEFGQGKSTALLSYCCNWANHWRTGDRSAPVPLLIELRGKSPRRQAPDRFLAEWGDRYGLRGAALLNLVQSGRATIIFEGFDEVQDAGLRYDRFEQFKALWGFSYPGTKIIFTGRPNFFLDTRELQTLLRASEAARDAGLANSEILALEFLERDGISKALSKYPLAAVQEILAQCNSDAAFMEIAKRPSMLPVIGNQWSNIKAELREKGGITSAAIIEYFIDFLYARKEADQDQLGEYQLLSRELRHYFTQRVAWKMMTERQKNTIDRHQFLQAIGDAYRSLDAEFRMDEEGRADVAGAVRQLKESFRETNETDIVSTIATDVRTNGIFAPDPAGGRDNLYFPHKQYFEFILGQIFTQWLRPHSEHSWLRAMVPRDLLDCCRFEPVAAFFAAGLLTPAELDNLPRLSFVDSVYTLMSAASASIFSDTMLKLRRSRIAPQRRLVYEITRACPVAYQYLFFVRKGKYTADVPYGVVFSVLTIFITFMSAAMFKLLTDMRDPSVALSGKVNFSLGVLVAFTAAAVLASTRRAFTALGPGFPSSMRDFHLLAQLYRRGAVERVLGRKGPEAHAALACLIARALPPGAVALPDEALSGAARTLGYNTDEVLHLLQES